MGKGKVMHEKNRMYKGTNTSPWDSNWAGARVGTTKHATGVFKVKSSGKRELGQHVGNMSAVGHQMLSPRRWDGG